ELTADRCRSFTRSENAAASPRASLAHKSEIVPDALHVSVGDIEPTLGSLEHLLPGLARRHPIADPGRRHPELIEQTPAVNALEHRQMIILRSFGLHTSLREQGRHRVVLPLPEVAGQLVERLGA